MRLREQQEAMGRMEQCRFQGAGMTGKGNKELG